MNRTNSFYIQVSALLLLLGVLAIFLKTKLMAAFLSNPWINGFIVFIWLIGIIHALYMVSTLRREYRWLSAFNLHQHHHHHQKPMEGPVILESIATMLDKKQLITTDTRETILDAVSIRLNAGNETAKYLTGLLIFLGLLGTFWGLLETVRSVGDLVGGVSFDQSQNITAAMLHLKSGLTEPLKGMGTAFSSSLFGLSFSLVLGFVYLQAQRTKNTFFSVVEGVLNVQTSLSSGDSAAIPENNDQLVKYIALLLNENAESVKALTQSLDEHKGTAGMDRILTELTGKVGVLSETISNQGKAILTMSMEQQKHALYLDDQTSLALRNSEQILKKLLEETANTRKALDSELRAIRNGIIQAFGGRSL